MKKINRFISSLLTAVISLAPYVSFNVSASDQTWQEAYLEAMDEYSQNPKEGCECRLVYLDKDDIPEFYIGDPMYYWYGGLYSYSDGELIKLKDCGFKDFFSAYSEKSGVFRNDYFIERAGSITGINFIKMENNSLIVLDELSHDIVNDIYKVNGYTVDKETYNNKIAEYSFTHVNEKDTLESLDYEYSFTDISSDYLTYDEMKQYLLDALENTNTDNTVPTESVTETENLTTTSVNIDNTTTETSTSYTSTTIDITSNTTANTTVRSTLKTGSPKTGDNGITAVSFAGIAAIGTALIISKRKS